MDLAGFGRCLSSTNPIGSCHCSYVYRLDPSDLRFSSSATVARLVRWSCGALARGLPDCLLQQGLPDSSEGGAIAAARLRLVPVLVVVARWSTDLDVIFITSCILCIVLTVDEWIGGFLAKKKFPNGACWFACLKSSQELKCLAEAGGAQM